MAKCQASISEEAQAIPRSVKPLLVWNSLTDCQSQLHHL